MASTPWREMLLTNHLGHSNVSMMHNRRPPPLACLQCHARHVKCYATQPPCARCENEGMHMLALATRQSGQHGFGKEANSVARRNRRLHCVSMLDQSAFKVATTRFSTVTRATEYRRRTSRIVLRLSLMRVPNDRPAAIYANR